MMGSQGIYYLPIAFKTEDQLGTIYAIKGNSKSGTNSERRPKVFKLLLALAQQEPFTGNRFETTSIIWCLQILCIQLTTSSYDMQFLHSL
jgi:hypothetical protein